MGAAHQGSSTAGLAHLLEHLMFTGSRAYSEDTLWDLVDGVGGSANAWTSHDDTTYLSRVSPDALPQLLDIEVARSSHPEIRPEMVAREAAIVADELRLRDGLEPSARLRAAFRHQALGEHPYGDSVGGTESQVLAATVEDVRALAEQAHTGAHLHIVVVGPHDPQAVYDEIAQRYRALPEGTRREEPQQTEISARRLRIIEPSLRMRLVGAMWPLPPGRPCASAEDPRPCTQDYWADQVALSLLSTKGAHAMGRQFPQQSSMSVPVDVVSFQGSSGGFFAVLARRRSVVGVAAYNTSQFMVALLFEALGVRTKVAVRKNPTPRLVRRELNLGSPTWIDDASIDDARTVMARRELARLWSSEARALSVAHRVGLGLSVDADDLGTLQSVDSQAVRASFERFTDGKGVKVHVR